MGRKFHSIKVAASLGLLALVQASAQGQITLYYNERPPYLVTQAGGVVIGLTAQPTANAFKKAGIPFVWRKMPATRQLLSLQGNSAEDCAVGWYKTAEREKFAKYTKPIYQDKPTVALARNEVAVREGERLNTLLSKPKLRVLLKDNYSYGAYIDALLARLPQPVLATVVENTTMVRMLRMGRADLMFMAEEEVSEFSAYLGRGPDELKLLRFPDIPRSEKRYILCSKKVPDEIISRLNQEIAFER